MRTGPKGLAGAAFALSFVVMGGAARAEKMPTRDPVPGHFRTGPLHGPAPTRPAPLVAPARRGQREQMPQLAPPWPEPTTPGPAGPRPYVDRRGRWLGHQAVPPQGRPDVDRPSMHGKFPGKLGHGHRYRLSGWDGDRHRFQVQRSFFVVAAADLAWADDWDWNVDDIVLYDDPDHPGWYLAYNPRLGTYVHVQYDGSP